MRTGPTVSSQVNPTEQDVDQPPLERSFRQRSPHSILRLGVRRREGRSALCRMLQGPGQELQRHQITELRAVSIPTLRRKFL